VSASQDRLLQEQREHEQASLPVVIGGEILVQLRHGWLATLAGEIGRNGMPRRPLLMLDRVLSDRPHFFGFPVRPAPAFVMVTEVMAPSSISTTGGRLNCGMLGCRLAALPLRERPPPLENTSP
jgi:hypothetical protein